MGGNHPPAMTDGFHHWKRLALGAVEAAGTAAAAIERTLAGAARPVGRMAVGAMRMTLAVAARGGVAALAVLALGAVVTTLAAVCLNRNARTRRAAMAVTVAGAIAALAAEAATAAMVALATLGSRQLQCLERLGGGEEAVGQRPSV